MGSTARKITADTLQMREYGVSSDTESITGTSSFSTWAPPSASSSLSDVQVL